MVRCRNLSAHAGVVPDEGADSKILGGPLYDLVRVKGIAKSRDGVVLWTRKCISDVADLGLDAEGVGDLIQELRNENYRGSEWCENGKGSTAACDAYNLIRTEYIENMDKIGVIEYFIKIAIGISEKNLLIVSCHL